MFRARLNCIGGIEWSYEPMGIWKKTIKYDHTVQDELTYIVFEVQNL